MMRMRVTKIQIGVVGLALTAIGLVLTVETIRPSVDYYFKNPSLSQFTDDPNSVTIYCKYGSGKLDAHFSLVVTFINSSFSDRTAKPYTTVDDSTVKFHFLLHEGESNQKMVYFTIHENVKGFSIELSLEKTNFFNIPLKPNPFYPTKLQYIWDEHRHFFVLEE